MLLGFGALAQFPNNPCAGPSQRVALVNLQKGAVVEGWRAGQIGLTDTCGNQFYQQYVEVNLTPIGYTPTATGNTANLSEFVITPAAEIWYIDWQGNAINLSGGGGGCDEDFLQISDNSCPDALTDSIYKYKYVSIGARGVWPVAELLVSDSVGVGLAVISGNRNGRVAIHDNLNDNWSVYDQGGSTTNIYVQDQGLFRVATATGSPQNAALLEEHFGVSTLDSTIIFYQYPNTRVDTQTAINFFYSDNLGIVRSKLLSQILGDSATVYNLSTINPLPTQYQKSTSFVRKNLNTATPIPQRGMWISNGSEWLWLGFVLDTNQVVTPFIANQNVTYPKIQNVTASRLLGNPTGAVGTVQEIKIGTNLYFSNDTLHANAGGAGQVLTAGDGSGDNKTLDLSGGGGTVTLDPAGIFTLSRTGNTLTMSAVEVDGSVTNEGVLGVGAGGGNDALLLSNTSGATGTTIAGGTGIQITETTSANGGTITITNTAADRDWLTITNLFPTVFDSFIYRRKPASIGTNIFRKASDLKHTPFQVVDSTGYLGDNAGILALFSGNRRGGVAFQDNNEPDGSAFSRITQRGQICQLSFVEGGTFELMSDDGTTLDEGTQTTRFTYYTADDEGGTAYWPDYGGSRSDTAQLFTVSGFGFGGKMVSKPASAVVGSSAFINGGNSFGTTTTLGTNDAQALNIETNGTTRATFTTDYALKLVEATAVPATPSNGVIFSNSEIAGKNIPFWMDPNGVPYEIAAARGTNRYYEWSAVPGSGTPSIWATTSSPYGTSSIPTLSASLIGQIVRIAYTTSATASSNAGTRNTSSTYLRGNAAGVGGFYYVGRWGFSTANTTDKRFFAGFRSSATQIPASTNPSSMTQIIGFGIDGGQTTLRFMVNDNTGTATTVDLGANFPTNTNGTDYYEARIFCPENGSTVYYHIKNIATGNVAFGSANTDLPNNTTLLSVHHHISNGADAVSVALDLSQFTIITKY